MEILHFVSLAVVIAISAMIHAYPNDSHCLAEFCTTTGKFGQGDALAEQFDAACFGIQPVGTIPQVGEPDEPVAVDEESCHFASGVRNDFGLLTIGENDDLTRLGAEEDVVSVSCYLGDLFIRHDAFPF